MSSDINQRMSVGRRGFLAGTAGLGLLGLAGRAGAFDPLATAITGPVRTTAGPIRGYEAEGVFTFKGVPYGQAPVGNLRFAPPQKPAPWTATRDCMRYGQSAMQAPGGGSVQAYPGISGPALGQLMGSAADLLYEDEDCLVLNVWTPALNDGRARPVMIFFHGGGYAYGSGTWPVYSGHNLAKNHDVVALSVNHRLNVMGYCDVSEIGGDPTSGNAGQLDLVQALEWIADNIENFGGDPDNVTIFGQSGGGGKVSTMMAMPRAENLFHKAIIQSGASLGAGNADQARQSTRVLMAKLGVSTLAQLREVPARLVVDTHLGRVNPTGAEGRTSFGPIIDGISIPRAQFNPEAGPLANGIPIMVGVTADEQTMYTVGGAGFWNTTFEDLTAQYGAEQVAEARRLKPEYPAPHIGTFIASKGAWNGAVTLAERKLAQPDPVYMYVFEWESPVENYLLRAPHTMELPFCFDNVDLGPLLLGENGVIEQETRRLGRITSGAWTNFAKTGNPNGISGLPNWPRYDLQSRATMFFNTPCRTEMNPYQVFRREAGGPPRPPAPGGNSGGGFS
jgi:para-nitrobenzyl esterase